jgi:HlyD family secretion protein
MHRLLAVFVIVATMLAACGTPNATSESATPTPRPPAPSLEKQTYTVAVGDVVDEIKVSGTVAALKQQDLAFEQNGFVKVINVERNDVITAGMVLAELDLGDLPNQLRQAEVNYEQVQIQYNRSATQRDLGRQRAQLDLEEAQANLSKLTNPQPEQVAQAKATLESAHANLANVVASTTNAIQSAEAELSEATRSLPLLQATFSESLSEWEIVKDDPDHYQHDQRRQAYVNAQNAVDRGTAAMYNANQSLIAARAAQQPLIAAAQANLDNAQIAYDKLTKAPNALELAAAERAVKRAEIAVQEASQTGDPELEKQLSAAQLQLENLQAAIAAGQLVAPFDGIVAEIGTAPGRQVNAYSAVLTVMDDGEKELLVQNVSTEDSARIGVGMAVSIFFARSPAVEVPGTIVKLPTKATSSASTINPDPAYHIEYTLPDGVEAAVGDLAQVVITLKRQENVLWLPPQAVRSFEGRRFVVVKDGERQRRQDVRVGIISSDRVEILEGLSEGDIVVGQ